MNKINIVKKEIRYCYPASEYAKQFRLKEGGYIVVLLQNGKIIAELFGKKTLAEIQCLFNTLPFSKSYFSL